MGSEKNIKKAKEWLDSFLKEYKRIGGKLDGLFTVVEYMRIDAFNQVTQLYKTNSTKKTYKMSTTQAADKLEISQMGKDYQVAKKAVASAPDVRAELVDSIKTAVQGGTYDVSDSDFADKLLEKYSAIFG